MPSTDRLGRRALTIKAQTSIRAGSARWMVNSQGRALGMCHHNDQAMQCRRRLALGARPRIHLCLTALTAQRDVDRRLPRTRRQAPNPTGNVAQRSEAHRVRDGAGLPTKDSDTLANPIIISTSHTTHAEASHPPIATRHKPRRTRTVMLRTNAGRTVHLAHHHHRSTGILTLRYAQFETGPPRRSHTKPATLELRSLTRKDSGSAKGSKSSRCNTYAHSRP